MRERRRKCMPIGWGIAGIIALAVVAVAIVVKPWSWGVQPNEAPKTVPDAPQIAAENVTESLSQSERLENGAVFSQTLTYLPCTHVVQRRIDAPQTLLGLDRTGLEKALPDYRITAFGSKEVVMQREMSMFCPDHWVLMPDEQGELCIWQNLMGEEMVRVRALGLGAEDVPESEQNAVRAGKPFESSEELEGWLESIDS